MPQLEPASPSAAPQEIIVAPATFNDRFVAYFIDTAPLVVGYCLTMIYAPQFARFAAKGWIGVYVAYQFLGNMAGGTIGKKMMGLKVLRPDGTYLGAPRSLLRALGHLVSTPLCNFGFLVALLHPENRALHDLLSGSVVLEPRRKGAAEHAVLFAAAALTLSGLYGLMLYLHLFRPTPDDLLAIDKAKQGLQVMAQIEESYKGSHGAYSGKLADLAEASGDPEQFRSAMSDLFDAKGFLVEAGNRGYRIAGFARDRKRTKVVIEGPPPTLKP